MAWTRDRQERRVIRERDFGGAIAATNAFRFNPVYGVIQTDDLALSALPAAKSCALFLSVPRAQYLVRALDAMRGWGFTYKSCWCWTFPAEPPVPGEWSRRNFELVLIGTRGKVPAPAPGTQPHSCYEGPNGREFFGAWIARTFPSAPRLTLWRDLNGQASGNQGPRT
jgi:N6-adenosine-specific RNA methylase IME4